MAVALALGAGAIALFSTCPERRGTGAAQQPPRFEPALLRETEALESLSELGKREVIPVALPVAEENAAPVEGEAIPEKRFGSIYGSIYDPRGELLGRRAVRFEHAAMGGFSRFVWSDENGAYELEEVPVGSWDAFYVGKTFGGNRCSVAFGKVEVLENQAAIFDFVLTEERILEGHLTVPEQDGILLQLELRSAWDDERIVAQGMAVTNLAEPLPPDEDPRMWENERESQASGLFRMEALSADRYVLRIVLGKDTEGRSIYLEREIDLTAGDVTLDEAFTYDDFVLASLQRWMSESESPR